MKDQGFNACIFYRWGASLYPSASVDVARTLCPVTLQERIKEWIPYHDTDSGPRIYFWNFFLPGLQTIQSPVIYGDESAAGYSSLKAIAAPQASHQLRRACEIMWRLQHGISPKTAKGPFVLCPCHCSFKTSAMPRAHPSSLILHPHHPSLILHPSHAFLILPPAMNQCPIHAWSLHPIPLSSSYVCSPQRLALILIPCVCSLHGAECVAVV